MNTPPPFGTATVTLNRPGGRALMTDAPSGPMIGLSFKNWLLTILTLGLYSFWAKTNVRRFLWSHTLAYGERLEYTGTGKELFIGTLVVAVAVFAPLAALGTVSQYLIESGEPGLGAAVQAFQVVAILYLVNVGVYRALRYRLSRTRWRGVRFGMAGGGWLYGLRAFGWMLLTGLTLGLLVPLQTASLTRRLWGEARFGDAAFTFTGRAGELYKAFFVAMAGMVVAVAIVVGSFAAAGGAAVLAAMEQSDTAMDDGGDEDAVADSLPAADDAGVTPDIDGDGVPDVVTGPPLSPLPFLSLIVAIPLGMLSLVYYQAATIRFLFNNLRLGDIRFRADVGAGSLFALAFVNLLIAAASLTILTPYTTLRTLRYLCDKVEMDGEPDFAAIGQNRQAVPGSGEGLVSVFDATDM